MSFFGLTSYGAQNHYAFNRPRDAMGNTVRSTLSKPGTASSIRDEEHLEEAIPGVDLARTLQPHLRVTPAETREFTSLRDLQYRTTKHMRSTIAPRDRFRAPMTTSQMYGWQQHAAFEERDEPLYQRPWFPLTRSDETRHAEIMFSRDGM